MVPAFLCNTLTGVEILNKGGDHSQERNDGHADQVTLRIVSIDSSANCSQNGGEQNGNQAGAHIAHDICGDGQILSLIDISCGNSRHQFLGHIPHGVGYAVIQIERHDDPNGLMDRLGEGHPEQQNHADQNQRRG